MSDPLLTVFAVDVGCPTGADHLAERARVLLPSWTGSRDDSPEDLAIRLRDSRLFGMFASSIVGDEAIQESARLAVAEHAFDLLPVPRAEGDVILVESRAPPHLFALARFLGEHRRLTILHLMHLLFAVFLDRPLVTNADRPTRTSVLQSVVAHPEAPEPVRVLLATLLLASLPEPEAHASLRAVLRGDAPASLKRALAAIASAPDGGVDALVRIARDEGLLPPGPDDPLPPSALASIPRLPARLAALGRRWLREDAGRPSP
jgi:hypothetical protein